MRCVRCFKIYYSMSIFDISDSDKLTIQQEGRILSAAIYEIYKEADKKRDELLKTVGADVAKFSLPSYRDLREEIANRIMDEPIVFREPRG